MHSGDLPSSFVNFLCARHTLHQLPSIFRASGRTSGNICQISVRTVDLPSSFINFPCCHDTLCQILSTFYVARSTFVHFCQLSLCPREFPSTFHAVVEHCGHFHQQFMSPKKTFFNFCQNSVRPRDLPLTSVNFLCSEENFCPVP